jgi:hypothetical protein
MDTLLAISLIQRTFQKLTSTGKKTSIKQIRVIEQLKESHLVLQSKQAPPKKEPKSKNIRLDLVPCSKQGNKKMIHAQINCNLREGLSLL